MKRNKPFGSSRQALSSLACVSALLGLIGSAHASMPGKEIGEVSFVLGKAWIQKAGAGRERIAIGTTIGVFDKIETASDGHVHIRFADKGLFSVRPSSTVEIQRYDYDAANPSASAVKFNLVEGEARSISGDAAKSARQNYRMNTPLAAIGVRGTDYVVSAGDNGVEARINQGAIVVAPFSSQCLADALGPCNASGLELAYGASQVLQVSADSGTPVMLAVSTQGLPDSFVAPVLQPSQVVAAPKEESRGELYAESVATLAVNQKIALTRANAGPSVGVGPSVPDSTPVLPPPREFTPDVAIAAQALKNSQLLWGHLYNQSFAHDRIVVDYATASEGRRGAVSNDTYALFRLENAPRVQPGLNVVGFALNSAQATYKSNGAIELLDVFGGSLNIDFNASTFATSLDMRSKTLGALGLSVSGRIGDGGYFSVVGPNHEMAGAVSLDGSEAGYFFEKSLETGVIDGVTLWGRQP